jgi:hypothetical protein
MRRAVVFQLIGLVLISIILYSCKKDEVPTVTTSAVSGITGTTATSGGTVTDEGTEPVLERGVCWSTGEPSVLDSKTVDGAGTGIFTSNISNLNPATQYYVRAYATNSVGTGYGMAIQFTTVGGVPNATTLTATDITTVSAKLNGRVNANHLSSTVTFEYGTTTTYGHTANPVAGTVTGNSDVNVSVEITDLEPGTTYHFRVKADNSLGSDYGDDEIFTTLYLVPTEGLVAYFPFNGNANDETENGNHGLVNGATLTEDRFGNPNSAYHFDGINDDINGTTNNWPFNKTPRTISLWCSLHTLVGESSSNHILDYGLTAVNNANMITYEHVSGGGKTVNYGAYYDAVSVNFDYEFDIWYNIVGTFDGTIASLYINGTLYSQQNKAVWNTLPGGFRIGSLDSWVSWWNGEIDDIRIYNRVLSQEEILMLYNETP